MFKFGDLFDTMAEAKKAVNTAILNAGQSYLVYKSEPTRYILNCKQKDSCQFHVRITYSKKTELATITKHEEHKCSPAIHYSNRAASSVQYLKIHHQDLITDNNVITPSIYNIKDM
jgi:hypothetical protein